MAFARDQARGDDIYVIVKIDYGRKQRRSASGVVPVLGERVRFLARILCVRVWLLGAALIVIVVLQLYVQFQLNY